MEVLPSDPEYLPLPNHLCCLDSLNRRPSCLLCPRSMHGAQAPLHVAVIRFNPVVTVSLGSLLAATMEVAFLLQFANSSRIAAQSIPSENPRRFIIGIGQSTLEEELGGFAIPAFR
jgi:hypothetical protein